MTQNTWGESITERVARAVRSARGNRSAQDIADETARLGYPLTRSQIANLESGRKRSLDIAELIVLAAALDVSPVALLYPDLPDGDVERLPGDSGSSAAALFWFTGEHDDPEEPAPGGLGRLLKLTRDRYKKIEQADRTGQLVAMIHRRGEDINQSDVSLLVQLLDDVEKLERQMSEIPGAVVAESADRWVW